MGPLDIVRYAIKNINERVFYKEGRKQARTDDRGTGHTGVSGHRDNSSESTSRWAHMTLPPGLGWCCSDRCSHTQLVWDQVLPNPKSCWHWSIHLQPPCSSVFMTRAWTPLRREVLFLKSGFHNVELAILWKYSWLLNNAGVGAPTSCRVESPRVTFNSPKT